MLVSEALQQAAVQLGASSEDADIKARLLLKHVLEVETAGLIAAADHELSPKNEKLFFQLVGRTLTGSVHRAMGFREFHSLEFDLHPDTLEPRDDTEALIEATLDQLAGRKQESLKFADIGTGTGAIAVSLLTELTTSAAVITDISKGALQTALQNTKKLGVSERCTGALGSWLEPLTVQFDFIVSNPPYIASSVVETLDSIVRDQDPRKALDGGHDGLDAYRIILRDAAPYLKPDGFLALEIGYDQADSVKQLAKRNGWKFENLTRDLGGNDRAVVFTP